MENPAPASTPTLDTILTALATTGEALSRIITQLGPVRSDGPDAGGWTPRQVLAHIIGSWQRVPIHAAFLLADAPEVPIQVNDDYWIPEWEIAPLGVFMTAMQVAYASNRRFIEQLAPADLAHQAQTPFGPMTLGDLLLVSCQGHFAQMHIPQLEAFLAR